MMNFLKTELGSNPVIVEGIFTVPAARVFEAWTDSDEITQWFGASPNSMIRAEIDLRVGGIWRFIFDETDQKTVCLEGEYIEVSPNNKLVFSWKHVTETTGGEKTATEASKVTLDFEELGDSTKVTLTHEGITSEYGLLGVGSGWENTFASFESIIAKTN